MEKSLQAYQFIPVNTEAGSDQFFIVQDDGTYLINRPVQYVTEVQDVKTVLDGVQSCTVYDVSEQPFFVDVDNSSELMAVTDEFVLPDASSNLYANSYLLQHSATTNQVEDDITEAQFKPSDSSIDLDVGVDASKPVNNCTEITLDDDQYQKLEQKGWLLLELNDKVFILDTLGELRDITSNDKLIQKLKNDDQNNVNWEKNIECVKVETNMESLDITQNLLTQDNTMECVIADDIEQKRNLEHLPSVADNKDKIQQQETVFVNQEIEKASVVNNIESHVPTKIKDVYTPQNTNFDNTIKDVKVFLFESDKDDQTTKDKKIRIKTKLLLKDIPDKIVLGKTTNGKTLVARVKKPEVSPKESVPKDSVETVTADNGLDVSNKIEPEDMQFTDLIRQAIKTPEQHLTDKDLHSIEMIINHLTEVPTFDPSIHCDDYLFISKVVTTENGKGNFLTTTRPTIYTGCVKTIDSQWRFIHLPNILQNLLFSDDYRAGSSTIIHIQILEEVRLGTNVVKTSVTVNKKQLVSGRSKRKETVYACSACASVFDMEQELEDHRKECLDSMDTSDLLDTIEVNKTIHISCVISGRNKHYMCLLCNAKFTRLNSCKKHIKTHYHQTNDSSNNVDKIKKKPNREIYKCNMCPSIYLHPSTLSKHIVSIHIKPNENM